MEKLSVKQKRDVWVKVFCEAIKSPHTRKSFTDDSSGVRAFAAYCANYVLEELEKIK